MIALALSLKLVGLSIRAFQNRHIKENHTMGIRRKPSATFNWKMTYRSINEKGEWSEQEFVAILRRLPQERTLFLMGAFTPWLDSEGNVKKDLTEKETKLMEEFIATTNKDEKVVREVLAGVSDLLDDSGNPIPWTEEALEDLISQLGFTAQFTSQWLKSLTEAPVKTSGTSPEAGQTE
jgi:hypothetical protein